MSSYRRVFTHCPSCAEQFPPRRQNQMGGAVLPDGNAVCEPCAMRMLTDAALWLVDRVGPTWLDEVVV